MFAQIERGVRRLVSAIVHGARIFATNLVNTVKAINEIGQRLFFDGYLIAARYTMDNTGEISIRRRQGIFAIIAKILLFPITTLPGFLVGAVFAPLSYYSVVNFTNYFMFPYKLLMSDLEPDKATPPTYRGGPAYIFGGLGFLCGFVLGAVVVALPVAVYRIVGNSLISLYFDFIEGVKIANWDLPEDGYPLDSRTKFAKMLGMARLGLFSSRALFLFGIITTTLFRIVVESFISSVNLFVEGVNLANFDLKDSAIPLFRQKRTIYSQYVLSIPGLGLGLIVGLISFTSVTFVRYIINSTVNFLKIFVKAANYPLQETSARELFGKPTDIFINKFSYSRYVLGFSGFLLAPFAISLGALFGSVIRITIESWKNSYNTAIAMLNFSLQGFHGYQPNSYYANRKVYEKVIGGLGSIVGMGVMLPITSLIGVVRYVDTNYTSGKHAFRYFTDSVLRQNLSQSSKANRYFMVKLIGVPGAIIGGGVGAFIRSIYETSYSAGNTLNYLLKASLIDSDYYQHENLKPVKEVRRVQDQILGLPGYVLGFAAGTFVGSMVLLARFAINNAISAKRAFALSVNATQAANKPLIKIAKVDHRNIYKRVAGSLGYLFGFLAGETGAISIESVFVFEYLFKNASDLALAGLEDSYKFQHPRPFATLRPIKGVIGTISGLIIGGLSFLSIGFMRAIVNTGQTAWYVTVDMVNFVLIDDRPKLENFTILSKLLVSDNSKYKPASDQGLDEYETKDDDVIITNRLRDTRGKISFRLGLIGLPIGGLFGSFAALLIGSGRITRASLIRAYNDALVYTSLALPKNLSLKSLQTAKQKYVPSILGAPLGLVFGIVFGAVGFSIALNFRAITNIFISIGLTAITVANFWPVNYYATPKDTRDLFDRALGFIGYLPGVGVGMVGWALHVSGRIIANSAMNTIIVFSDMTFWAIGSDRKKFILGGFSDFSLWGVDSRSFGEKYGFGLIGYLLGGIFSIALVATILSIRLLGFNLFSATAVGFKQIANVVLPTTGLFGMQIAKFNDGSVSFNTDINKVSLGGRELEIGATNLTVLKVILGFPGLVIGSTFGVVFAIVPITMKNFVVNNYQSFKYLSKALINVGLEEPIFKEGLAADKRSGINKAAGIFGYTMAISTAGLLPVAHLLFRVTLVLFALAASVFVAPIKAGLIIFKPRFKKGTTDDAREKKFRNLYSSLVDGEFISGQAVKENQSGGKGSRDFVRKSTRLNTNTIAEDVLEVCMRESSTDIRYDDSLKREIKSSHYSPFFFTTSMRRASDAAVDKEVEETVDFVAKHVSGEIEKVPDIHKQREKSYFELLQGESSITCSSWLR